MSSMLKLNPDEQFIMFMSNALQNKFDSHLPFRIFGNFLHLAVVVKNFVSGLILILPLLIMSTIFVRLILFKCVILGG